MPKPPAGKPREQTATHARTLDDTLVKICLPVKA